MGNFAAVSARQSPRSRILLLKSLQTRYRRQHAIRDFRRFGPGELPSLVYKVDVLSPAEKIDSESQLDVKKYGVIVENGPRRGLLLPDLEGVDTVEQQIAIAKQKANIAPHEGVQLYRFTVTRHQ